MQLEFIGIGFREVSDLIGLNRKVCNLPLPVTHDSDTFDTFSIIMIIL